jgi:hypothetical protein
MMCPTPSAMRRHPTVRRVGGGSDPQWERRRPASARLHPDVVELLKLQEGWQSGFGRRAGK